MTAENVPAAAPAAKGNWLVAILAGIAGGLVGAIIYAAVMVKTDNEIGYLAILIGFLVGFAMVKFGKVSGLPAAIVAAVVAFVFWAFALELSLAWYSADQGAGTILGNLGELFPESLDLLKSYFEYDAMGYLFAALAAAGGLFTVLRLGSKK